MTNQYQNKNQQTTKPEEPKCLLEVDPIKFDGLIKSKLTTTIGIGKLLWGLFKPVFPEYEGCVILPDQYGQMQVTLYFKDKGRLSDPNSIKAVTPIGASAQSNNSAYDRIASINQRLSSKKFDLTKDAKEILEEFYWVRKGQKVNWTNYVTEVTSQDYNGYSVHLKITGLDLTKVLKKIYGGKVDGTRFDYAISIVKPIGMDVSGLLQNYLISIQQLDTREVENLAREVGVIPVQGSIPMLKG